MLHELLGGVRAGPHQDVIERDQRDPILHPADLAVGDPDPVRDRVHLKVRLDEVPVALVARPRGVAQRPGVSPVASAVVLPAADREAIATVDVAHQTVAGAHRAILGERVAAEVAVAPDERVVVVQHAAGIDIEGVLERQHGGPGARCAVPDDLGIGREVRVGVPHVVAIGVGDEVEHVRMIGLARADPVRAELHPEAQVHAVRGRELVTRRGTTRAAGGPRSEVALERARAPRGVLRRADGAGRCVVPPARGEARVVEVLLEQDRSSTRDVAGARRRIDVGAVRARVGGPRIGARPRPAPAAAGDREDRGGDHDDE